jgi:hypothetical protein
MYDSTGISVTSLSIDNAILTSLPSSSNLVFSYAKFKNPRSTNKACSSFKVTVTTSAGNTIESGSGGSITVLSSNTLSTFQITADPTSLTNGQTATYIISSTPNSFTPFIATDKYYITFPSEIDISLATCTTIT